MVAPICHVDITRAIRGHALRIIKLSRTARAVGNAGRCSKACQSSHYPPARHLPDRMVIGIRHVDVPGTVHSHALRKIKPSRTARAVGRARETSRTSQGGHHACARHFPNRVVISIRNVHITGTVHGRASWTQKQRCRSRAIRRTRYCLSGQSRESIRRSIIRLSPEGPEGKGHQGEEEDGAEFHLGKFS